MFMLYVVKHITFLYAAFPYTGKWWKNSKSVNVIKCDTNINNELCSILATIMQKFKKEVYHTKCNA